MSSMLVPLTEDQKKRRKWRLEELRRVGYDKEWAEMIAESDIDLNMARSLLERGCPVELALSILI